MSPEHTLAVSTSSKPEKKLYACIKKFELKNEKDIQPDQPTKEQICLVFYTSKVV